MQWVDSSYQLIKPEWGVEEMFKNIERAGRICYASEPKEGVTARQFTERLIKSNHLSPLEFGICYLHYWCKKPADAEPTDSIWDTYNILTARYKNNKYSKCLDTTIFESNGDFDNGLIDKVIDKITNAIQKFERGEKK